MSEEPRPVKYYCTAGSGMELFLSEEVKRRLCAHDVEYMSGRVFFSTSASMDLLTQLKSAERLFLLLRKAPPISCSNNSAKLSRLIQQSVLGDPDVWGHTLSTWIRLQTELKNQEGRGQKRKREEEEEGEEVDGNRERKKCLRGRDPTSPHTHVSETNPGEGSGPTRPASVQSPPAFRVSCRCSGAITRSFTSQDLNRILGKGISQQLGWRVDLRESDLEVNVYINDDHCILGIPLLRQPLASRRYIKHSGLRSTVSWAMASLCRVKEGSVIIDPMCGVGIILMEAAKEWPDVWIIGMDSDESQLLKAAENVESAGLGGRVELLKSSAMEIPLPSDSVDAVVCDVPFGRKFSCGTHMTSALPQLVTEMERVLSVNGSLVLLLSLQLSAQLKKIINAYTHSTTLDPETRQHGPCTEEAVHIQSTHTYSPLCSLQLQSTHRLSLGSTDALIHTYTKTHTHTHTHKLTLA